MLLGLVSGCPPELQKGMIIVTKNGTLSDAIAQYGVRVIPAKPGPIWNAVNQSAGIILGGGTHFHDDYLRWRYVRHVRYLLRYLLIFTWAKLWGKKVLWLGMGIGPFSRPLTRWLLQWGIHTCDHITVRDTVSANELYTFAESVKVTHTFDLAALIRQTLPSLVQAPRHRSGKTRILGLSVVEANLTQTGKISQQHNFWSQFTTALERIYRHHPDLHIRVYVIRGGQREDDMQASLALVELLNRYDPARVSLIPYNEDPTVTLASIAECDVFVATRFHSAIFSYLVGCRLLLLAYHRKLQDLAQEIRLSPNACIDIAQPTTVAEVEAALEGLLGKSSDYIAQLPVEEAHARASRNIHILNEFAAR